MHTKPHLSTQGELFSPPAKLPPVEPRREKARRGELIVSALIGYIESEDQRLEKDPDLRVQRAILLVLHKFAELGTVRQTLMWFLEHGLEVPTRTPRGETRWKRPCTARCIAC